MVYMQVYMHQDSTVGTTSSMHVLMNSVNVILRGNLEHILVCVILTNISLFHSTKLKDVLLDFFYS